MIRHVYLYRLKEPKRANEISRTLQAMLTRIPSVFSAETGTDFIHSGSSCDMIEIVTCRDEASFRDFCTHPYHDEIRAYMKEHYETAWKVDYIVGAEAAETR